jgi:hypothetical protein
MAKLIEASLTLTLSIVITLIIMAVIFPHHLRGGAMPEAELTDVVPAVFVYGTHERPGTVAQPDTPDLSNLARSSGCPYLAALAAASSCPAFPNRAAEPVCPFVRERLRQLRDAETAPSPEFGKHL